MKLNELKLCKSTNGKKCGRGTDEMKGKTHETNAHQINDTKPNETQKRKRTTTKNGKTRIRNRQTNHIHTNS